MSDKLPDEYVPRTSPAIAPMGFRISAGAGHCVIDFIDMPIENKRVSVSAVAISKSQAEQLVKALNEFIAEES